MWRAEAPWRGTGVSVSWIRGAERARCSDEPPRGDRGTGLPKGHPGALCDSPVGWRCLMGGGVFRL